MRPATFMAASCTLLLAACGGGDPLDIEKVEPVALLVRPGDQIHPSLDDNNLVWFDLEGDPNGACFTPAYSGDDDYDSTCDGVIRVLNLRTGWMRTLSEVIHEETIPVISDGQVAWLCRREQVQGLCVCPLDRKEVSFHPNVGWNRYYWYSRIQSPAVNQGKIVWGDYSYENHRTVHRIMMANLATGEAVPVAYPDTHPIEVTLTESLVAWSTRIWEEGSYSQRLQAQDIRTDTETLHMGSEEPLFGLAGESYLLAWKQGYADYGAGTQGVHVYYRDEEGLVHRADGDESRVSTETPMSLADGLLLWLDHREGAYQVFAYDSSTGEEARLSPDEAVVGAYMPPATDGEFVVWTDLRDGDWDLFIKRL